ncbi:MAG: BMP family ABC transporter substrate-binding protein [Anaerolineae bacterium]|nr:BMP family ABC transporter substrate-binding protein [Anaerolineae bacterium]
MFKTTSKKRLWVILCLLALIAVFVLAACGDDDDKDDKDDDQDADESVNAAWKIGLVTNVDGTITDGGFSESAHIGAERAFEDFSLGDYAYAQSKDEADYAIQLDQHINAGRNIIVTVGFNMEAITYQYATAHPDVYFVGVDQGYFGLGDIPANLIGLQFVEDEASFVAGALAGMMTTSNIVAVVGGMEIPPVVRLAEGFRNGAQYVNPDAEVLIVYTGDFGDPDLGTATAQDFIDAGADVIFGAGGLTGSAGIQYAAREGVWVVGVDQDEWRTNFAEGTLPGSNRILTSAVKRVDSGVYQAIETIINGVTVEGGILHMDAARCGVGYAPFHEAEAAVSADAQTMLEAIWRALAGDTLETGVADPEALPEPLAEGALPVIADDAPQWSDCDQ